MKKQIALVLMAAMVVTAVGCGTKKQVDAPKQEAAPSAEAAASTKSEAEAMPAEAEGASTELTVWCWDPKFNILAIKEAEKIYQVTHPEFKLNIVEMPYNDIETKIITAKTAGDLSTLPDILLVGDNNYSKFLVNYPDVFIDLTDSGIDFTQFTSAKIERSVMGNKNFGVPFDSGVCINAMRTDILEKAGLTLEDFKDITWSQYIELGKKVKEATGLPMMVNLAGEPDLILSMVQSCGASILNEDGTPNIAGNEALKKSIELYTEMVKTGVIVEVTDWEQYVSSMNKGTACGTVNACWIMGTIRAAEDQSGKWGITNIPSLDGITGATNYSNNGGSTWAITSNSINPDLAVDFLKTTFAGSKELYETILPQSGALATWLPASESMAYQEPQEFFGGQKVFAELTDYAAKVPANVNGPLQYNCRSAIGVAVTNVIQTGADLDTELKAAQDTVNFEAGN